jgi:hypothetical protein
MSPTLKRLIPAFVLSLVMVVNALPLHAHAVDFINYGSSDPSIQGATTGFGGQTTAAPVSSQSGTTNSMTPGTVAPASSNTGTTNSMSQGQVLANPLQSINSLDDLLKAILAAIVKLGAILLTVALVWVGFLFVKAQGNPGEIKTARSALIYTLIGGLILLGAQAISLVIQSTVSAL